MVSTAYLRLSAVLLASSLLAGCNSIVFPSFDASVPGPKANEAPELARIDGNTPKVGDELGRAKAQFRERNFGLAEKKFRGIIESEPRNAEAWLGLAASYDQLRKFKLADRAYKQVKTLNGASVAFYNNKGYSYLLRGNRRRARHAFRKAQRMEPKNEFVRNNLQVLARRKR